MKLGMIRNACDEAAFQYIKEKNLDFIEVCCNYPDDAKAFNARGDEIKALVERHGIPVLSCGRWNGDGGPLDASGKIRPELLAEAKDEFAKATGGAAYECPVTDEIPWPYKE